MTKIEWTDQTWNPTTGCDRISRGCDNCYALTMAKRLKAMGQEKYQTDGDSRTSGPGFGVTVHPDALAEPYRWRKPRKVFVNSMSDLFHARVPLAFVQRVFEVMADTPQHTYQVLTKRAHRLPRVADKLPWPANVWMGVSAEDQGQANARIPHLLATPAAVKFVSAEPLLGPVRLDPAWTGLDWLIAGGESGKGARPMHPQWLRDLRDQCAEMDIAYFLKQWGEWYPQPIYSTDDRHHVVMLDGRDRGTPWSGWRIDQPDAAVMERVGKKAAGRVLDGDTHDAFPEVAAHA